MDNPSEVSALCSHPSPKSDDSKPRVKLLCSFSGSIMPRPQDGMLRYVGGETRIVSLPRDISYAELMSRMRELYEEAMLLKYQQPDEDLDALVSVVNDDDLANMMEEYDKFGSCEGFVRLRVFLFPNTEQDGSLHFVGMHGRDSERRYVDALNNFNDASAFRNQQRVVPSFDEAHMSEQFFNQVDIESSAVLGRKSFEVPMQHVQLRHLKIPQMGLGPRQQQPAIHRYNEMEAPWSPAHHSPMLGHHDPRQFGEVSCSPSSVQSYTHTDLWDRTSEDYHMQQLNSQYQYEYHPHLSEAWLPAGLISDRAGYHANIPHGLNAFQGNNVCESFQMAYPQNQGYLDYPWKHVVGQSEHVNVENEICTFVDREAYFPNTDPNIHHGCLANERIELRSPCCGSPCYERGCTLKSYVRSIEKDEGRGLFSSENTTPRNGNLCDCQGLSLNYIHLEDPRYVQVGRDLGGDLYHAHVDEHMLQYGNLTYPTNAAPQPSHVMGHPQSFPASFQNSAHCNYGAPMSALQNNDSVFLKNTLDGSPSFQQCEENQGPLFNSSPKRLVPDGCVVSGRTCNHALKINPGAADFSHLCPPVINKTHSEVEMKYADNVDPIRGSNPYSVDKVISSSLCGRMLECRNDAASNKALPIVGEVKEGKNVETSDCIFMADICSSRKDVSKKSGVLSECENACPLQALAKHGLTSKIDQPNYCWPLEDTKVFGASLSCFGAVTSVGLEKNEKGGQLESPVYSENENIESFEIELTEAEEEAIARGLQTIKNDDLEEIKELGCGTYGAVYHGKWKGSDVAIKRIKASCFAGRPSERERLIADFWKEALILSSLHHPNVVSFYGVVRDGPDGSLATITEFMINGSLKQFLQKKDRTIDRRKRLIIAMDAAFGMEYLHEKNIVHFDLKCENLLVNMRDPQRPICKIGDLGLSKVKQHTLVSGGVRGTLPWMAPELLSGKNIMVTDKIDVYSFGIVMWELLTGEDPYGNMHCATMIGRIVNNTLRPEIPAWCDPEWKGLMQSCWTPEASDRPPFSVISQKLRAMATAMNIK